MKRAVSPLVSTFILIIFAVSLGVVVMNWGKTGYVSGTSFRSCSQVSLNVVSLENQLELCYLDDEIRFILENDGEVDVDSVRVVVLGENTVENVEIKKSINVAEIKQFVVPIDLEKVGRIRKIKIVPGVEDRSKELLCVKNGFETERINLCG